MKTKTILFLLIIFKTLSFNAQYHIYEWAKKIGGSSVEKGKSITTDINGNVYTTGLFFGTVDFDPGVGIHNLTSEGGMDIFIQKLDSDGNFIWAKSMGNTLFNEGNDIITDSSGNVYTTGVFRGTVDFDPGIGVQNLTSAGLTDIFIQKLDSDGNFIWVKGMGASDFDHGLSITIDTNGYILTTGLFKKTVDFNPNAGVLNLTSIGNTDAFIQKLDSDGNFIWAKQIGGINTEGGALLPQITMVIYI